jgi:hypothetical protein
MKVLLLLLRKMLPLKRKPPKYKPVIWWKLSHLRLRLRL